MRPHEVPSRPDGREADDLNALLDAFATGQQPPTTNLDPALAASARHINDFSDAQVAPRLSQTESERLWEDLMQTHTLSPALPYPNPIRRSPANDAATASLFSGNARHREARLLLVGSAASAPIAPLSPTLGSRGGSFRRRWTRHGWPIVELVGAAALIIGLVSVIMSGFNGNDGGRPAFVPMAGVGTATPSAESGEVAAIPDPGQTGVMPGPGINGQPELIWRVPIQDNTGDLVVSDGTIVRSHFSSELPADFPNSTNPWTIEALSARAGTPIWESKVEASGVQIGGVWQGTIIVVATGQNSPVSINGEVMGQANEGYVIGLDLTTGDVKWSTLLVSAPAPVPTVSVPTITNGIAYVPTALGQIVSVEIVDGSINWTATMDDGDIRDPEGRGFSRAAVADGIVSVYSSASNSVVAFDAATGEQRWALQVNDPPVLGTPVAGIDVVLEPAPSVSGPAITGGKVFVSIGSYFGDAAQSLMAIDLASGEALWTTDLGSIDLTDPNRQRGVSQPYVTADAVIVSIGGSDGNRLMAFSLDTGEQVWEHRLGDGQSSQMSIVDETGYVARVDGTLSGIDLQTGDELWSVETGGALHGAPYIVDGMLYQAADDGQLYALGEGGTADATPGASNDISGLPGCDVEPRAASEEVFAMAENRTPAATLVEPVYVGTDTDQFPTAPTIAWNDLPVGTPADADVATAIEQTVDGITTCTRAGDQSQVAAYYTDDYFSRPYNLGVAEFSRSYFPSSEIPAMSGDLRMLNDGRVGMITTEGLISREIGQNEAKLYIFAEQPDGQWLIDEVVIVNNSGEAPQG